MKAILDNQATVISSPSKETVTELSPAEKAARVSLLVEEHMHLVPRVVSNFTLYDRDEAVSDAQFALFNAARSYVDRGLCGNFAGYAYISMRNALYACIQKNANNNTSSLDAMCDIDEHENAQTIEGDYLSYEEVDYDNAVFGASFAQFVSMLSDSEKALIAQRIRLFAELDNVTLTDVSRVWCKEMGREEITAGAISKLLARLHSKYTAWILDRGDYSE